MSETLGDLARVIAQQCVDNTVTASAGKFETHPESYRPRVFVKTEHGAAKTYELLQDGQAVVWPRLPDKETCGFPFWVVNADDLKDITMRRPK
jgi:hypothetical protein